jgi:NAD(P)-dependent dehydrogenase (short-subunit alcohol dehydrogenase family)
LAFAEHGATKLALTDINGELLHKSVNALKAKYPHVEVLEMSFDVRVGVEVEKAIADTVAKFGRLDIAVNNAGIGGSGKQTHMVDEEEWLNVVDVNLNAVRKCQKEQLKVMLNQEYVGDYGCFGMGLTSWQRPWPTSWPRQHYQSFLNVWPCLSEWTHA